SPISRRWPTVWGVPWRTCSGLLKSTHLQKIPESNTQLARNVLHLGNSQFTRVSEQKSPHESQGVSRFSCETLVRHTLLHEKTEYIEHDGFTLCLDVGSGRWTTTRSRRRLL